MSRYFDGRNGRLLMTLEAYLAGGLFGVLGSRCLTGSALLDCHVLKVYI